MSSRNGPGTPAGWRGWVAVSATALVVTGLVAGVWIATSGSPASPPAGMPTIVAPTDAPSSSVPSPTPHPDAGPARAVMLFADTAVEPPDVTRVATVDLAGAWPLGACGQEEIDQDRVDFVSGTERGPEYARDLAMGWYTDEAVADLAYTGLRARIEACASTTGATVQTAASGLGTAGVLATVAQPSIGGWSEVSIYALTRLGGVVALAVDHASFSDATVPAPADATTTRAHAERLLAEACRVEPARC